MRLRAARLLLAGIAACALALSTSGCENPFDPIDKSEKIEGLSYIDYSLSWDRWDTDPLYDGVIVSFSYFSEFGDSLSFRDKPVDVTIEFYTQVTTGDTGAEKTTYGSLFFSYQATVNDADDEVRIPIEAYQGALPGGGSESVDAFVIVRLHPPQDSPQPELVVGYADQTIYVLPENDITPNG